MTDAISTYGRIAQTGPGVRDALKKDTQDVSAAAAARDDTMVAKPVSNDDTLELSAIAQRAMQTDVFDRDKVEAIKQAIRDGQYPLDARRIAESFQTIESLIES